MKYLNVTLWLMASVLAGGCSTTAEEKYASVDLSDYLDTTLEENKHLADKLWRVAKRYQPKYPQRAINEKKSGCVN